MVDTISLDNHTSISSTPDLDSIYWYVQCYAIEENCGPKRIYFGDGFEFNSQVQLTFWEDVGRLSRLCNLSLWKINKRMQNT